ncbi:hypothetical protein M105_1891 [Bacteroides fragilis str. 1009-4-F |nr:hypothetical protein M105_1891 [Bacteroides fragilis str. 1009-4-F \
MQSRKNNIFFTIHFIYIGTSSYFSFSKKKTLFMLMLFACADCFLIAKRYLQIVLVFTLEWMSRYVLILVV